MAFRAFKRRLCASAMVACLAAPAIGQTVPAVDDSGSETSDSAAKTDEIVVTGTLLRGVAPGGSQAIGVNADDINVLGSSNSAQILASIPQTAAFNAQPIVRAGNRLTINRPDIRGLSINNLTSATSPTLQLLDGHRLPGMGLLQNGPDSDFLAIGALERVEVVTDGGSSTYGSDAVGGVVNYITRRRFDGVQVQSRYGIADDYQQIDTNVTVGKDWGWGSAYIAYNYHHNDEIYNFQRDFVRAIDWVKSQAAGMDIGSSLNCNPGNVSIGGRVYALPNLVNDAANNGNRCNGSAPSTFFPQEERHSVFGRLTLDDGGAVTASITGFYAHRVTQTDTGPLLSTAAFSVPTSSLSYIRVPGVTGTETINLNFAPVFGNSNIATTRLETYGFTPELQIDLGSRWRVKAMANYGYGRSASDNPILNTSAITAAIAGTAGAGTINFLDLTAAANATALARARDFSEFGRSSNSLLNTRVVADGPLFHIPGGDIQVAVGGEYIREEFNLRNSAGVTSAGIAALPRLSADRRIEALFGEINIPIFGPENAGFIHSLSLSASGRYDHYSDFGGTFNPKLGFNLAPFEWLKFRGNWGKSFQAPGTADLAQAGAPRAAVRSANSTLFQDPLHRPTDPINQVLLLIGGTLSPLRPQKARTYSFGFDAQPPINPGLAVGATYYKIRFVDQIASVPFTLPSFWRELPNNYAEEFQGAAAIIAFRDKFVPLVSNPGELTSTPLSQVYAVIDARTQNLGITVTDGIDFYVRFRTPTSFGALFFDVSGNRGLNYDTQVAPTASVIHNKIDNVTPRLRLASSVGAEVGTLRGQFTWNHADSYPIIPAAASLNQAKIGAGDYFNLSFQYKVPSSSGVFKDLSFTLNVDNVFDTDPPINRANSQGYESRQGFNLGRLIKFGVEKQF